MCDIQSREHPFVIAISGASNILGSALTEKLTTECLTVGSRPVELVQIVRGQSLHHLKGPNSSLFKGKTVVIAPEWTQRELDLLECCDVIIHLASESVAEGDVTTATQLSGVAPWITLCKTSSGSWTDDKKEEVLKTQVKFTEQLVDAIKKLKIPPQLFICASDIAYYGASSGAADLAPRTDYCEAGESFLAKIFEAREASVSALESVCRIVYLRFGLILSGHVGFIPRLISLFSQGKTGCLGQGQQWHSFISLADAIQVLIRLIREPNELSGPMNVTAPEPVSDMIMMKTLHDLLLPNKTFRAAPLPAEQFRVAIGGLSEDALLAGCRVKPDRLISLGYEFLHPDIESALRWCIECYTSSC